LQYDLADDFINGMARVSKDKKFGFIGTDGKILIPLKYNNAHNFSEGVAAVKEDKWGFINEKGNYVIPAKYDDAVTFYQGNAVVAEGTKRYYIDHEGKYIKDVPKHEEEEEMMHKKTSGDKDQEMDKK